MCLVFVPEKNMCVKKCAIAHLCTCTLLLILPSYVIGHDAQNHWLYVNWKDEYDQESSRAACGLMLKILQAWPCYKILNDNTRVSRTTAQLMQWGVV